MLSIDSKLYQMLNWGTRFMMANILWLGYNLPIIYIIFVSLTVRTMDELYHLVYVILFLLPFIFFPATTALYAVVRQWVIGNREKKTISFFWMAYKENYLRSMIVGCLFTGFSVIWVINYQLAQIEFKSGMFYVYFVITIFLFAIVNAFCADTVHLKLKFGASLKKSVIIGLLFPHYTISTIGVSGVGLYILYQIHPVVFFLYCGVIPVIVGFYGYYHLYKRALKLQEKTDNNAIRESKKALSSA